jgi:hypothetical protein
MAKAITTTGVVVKNDGGELAIRTCDPRWLGWVEGEFPDVGEGSLVSVTLRGYKATMKKVLSKQPL